VRALSPDDDAITVEAGVVLADTQAAAADADRLFPLSMASEGSARIGGALATNAGGVQVLRYGTARDLVLGIEAVLPDGSVHHGLKTLRKDNTGYDLRHLLIGAEGTLGVITAASLRLFPRPGEVVTAMLAVPSPAAALALMHRLRARIEGVSAFELISGTGIAFVRAGWPDRVDPLAGDPPWRVLVEATGPSEAGLAGRFLPGAARARPRGGRRTATGRAPRIALTSPRRGTCAPAIEPLAPEGDGPEARGFAPGPLIGPPATAARGAPRPGRPPLDAPGSTR